MAQVQASPHAKKYLDSLQGLMSWIRVHKRRTVDLLLYNDSGRVLPGLASTAMDVLRSAPWDWQPNHPDGGLKNWSTVWNAIDGIKKLTVHDRAKVHPALDALYNAVKALSQEARTWLAQRTKTVQARRAVLKAARKYIR